MSLSIVMMPLAVIALASLVGWAMVRWVSRVAALSLVAALVLAAAAMVALALAGGSERDLSQGVVAVFVVLPAALGVVLGAMMAGRGGD